MTITPADELRAAAARLRALAAAASTDTDGTPTTQWSAAPCRPNNPDGTSHLYGDYRTRDDGRRIAWPPLLRGGSQQRPTRMQTQHAEYAAAMGPALGLALADWLDETARYASLYANLTIATTGALPAEEEYDSLTRRALAVARQILDTTETATGVRPAPARVGRCPVMIEGVGRCEKDADHRAGRWPDDPHTPEPAPSMADTQPETDVVAYRDPNHPRVLLCRDHGKRWHGVVPVTSEDLPDGGLCTFGRLSSHECGRDVLAAPAVTEELGR